MVYKFKVLSDEDAKFFMDIEITSDQTFYDLHELIQDELEYDRSHLATFFIASHNWERKQEIPLIEIDDKSSSKLVPMDKAILANYIKDARQKIIYLFDFINDRSFFLELIETKTENSSNHYYPVCTDFGGEIPAQFSKKTIVKNSIFDEDETDSDVFSAKKAAPVIDDDFDEDFGGDSFDKDISFEIDDDALIAADDDEPDDEPEQAEEDPDDDD